MVLNLINDLRKSKKIIDGREFDRRLTTQKIQSRYEKFHLDLKTKLKNFKTGKIKEDYKFLKTYFKDDIGRLRTFEKIRESSIYAEQFYKSLDKLEERGIIDPSNMNELDFDFVLINAIDY